MFQIVFLCAAVLFVGNCESAEFEVLIDGMNVGRNSSCMGETVIYVCNITSSRHIWNVPGSVTNRILNWDSPPETDGTDREYTLRVVSEDGTNIITSSFSVSSSAELNGTNITCADGFNNDSTRATTVAMVLDPPSLPELNVSQVMGNNRTVNIMVTPPLVSPECVLQYNIITYSNCEGIETNVTVNPNNTDPVEFTRGGLNLCTCSYNFTAVAVTRNGIGERTNPVTIKISGIVGNPDLTITNDGFIVTVSIQNPQEPSVSVDVKHSSAGDTNCVINVERNTNITSSETRLDCSFAKLTPTFCVQFIDGSCQSELVQITTATQLPSLLSGVKINSSTSSIDVIVDVNEGINCDTSQLSTRTTIRDGNRVIYMNTSAFGDQVIVFEPPSPGLYTCRISIMSGNIVLDSMEEPCSNTVDTRTDSSESSVPIIVGCVAAGVLFVLILIVVIVVLVKKGCCERCCCESCEESGCKEKKSSSHSDNNATTTSVTVGPQDPNSTDDKHKDPLLSMYQDPNSIKHETAAGGEVYTMVEKKPKAKKGKEEKDDMAAMYSMPDKSKKNPELTYADVQVSNPQRPPNNRGIGNRSVFQQDTSSVTYASVESPTTKF